MKTNEAPEKIYLQVCGDCTLNDKETCEQCCKDNPINNGREVTWCVDKIFDNDIEYTRTDAFIEKTIRWLKESITNNPETNRIISLNGIVTMGMLIEDFRTYMKGE